MNGPPDHDGSTQDALHRALAIDFTAYPRDGSNASNSSDWVADVAIVVAIVAWLILVSVSREDRPKNASRWAARRRKARGIRAAEHEVEHQVEKLLPQAVAQFRKHAPDEEP